MRILDAHTHIDEMGAWQDPPGAILRLMDEAGVERAVVMTYRNAPADQPAPGVLDALEYTRRAIERYPARLIGFARLNPRAGAEAERLLIRAVRDYGMRGLKLHPVSYRALPDSPETLRLLRLAGELGVPALFHCGDEEYTLPLQIERAAAACPETAIILGHMGGYFHVDEAIDLLRKARAENPRFWFIHFWLAGALGLQGNLDEARASLAQSLKLKPAMNSLARRRDDVPWIANPLYWALQEKTLNIGLRRAGFPDE